MTHSHPAGSSRLDSLITQATLAERLDHRDKRGQVSTRTLEDWRAKGSGPEYVRLGRTPYYEPAAVDAWIAANRFQRTADEARF